MNSFSSRLTWMGLCVFFSVHAFAKETITWRMVDWPPFYILEGDYKGQGFTGELLKMLKAEMPEYEHRTSVMNYSRFKESVKNGEKVCNPTGIPGEFMKLSKTAIVVLSHSINIRTEKLPALEKKSAFSLKDLLNREDLKLGVTFGRFPGKLKALLEPAKNKKNIINVVNYDSIIEMLFNGRFDYTIEYNATINYHAQVNKKKGIVSSVLIEELQQDPFLRSGIACPDNEWGRKVLEKINGILDKKRTSKDFAHYAFSKKWYQKNERDMVNEEFKRLIAEEK